MSNKNGCVYVTSLILLISYEVGTQNYYHTLDTEREGDYDFILKKPKPEYLFGIHGNPVSPQKTILNGNNINIQRPIPNALNNYHVTYKPSTQEVAAIIMNVPPMNDNKDANNNLTPKIDAYLVANELNNGEDVKLTTKDNGEALDNNNTPEYSKQLEVNYENTKDRKQADSIKNETVVTLVRNETASSTVKNGAIIKPTDTMNILPNKAKAEKVHLIGEPLIKIMSLNIGDNLPRTKSNIRDNKSKKKKDHVNKIEITLPESDTTTVIISSRNGDEHSNDTKEEPQQKQNSHLAHQQISSANNLKHNRTNLGPSDKAIEFNKNERVDLALNQKIWPIPLAYAISSHKVNTPFYSHIHKQ